MAAGPTPQQAVISAEEIERYERALASLTKAEQQAIVLRIELELDYTEIAVELGKPSADAARMAVSRAIVRLADKMGPGRRRGAGRGATGKGRRGSAANGI